VNDRNGNRAAVERVSGDGVTIAVNGFNTMLGFLSLLTSRVAAIREFGVGDAAWLRSRCRSRPCRRWCCPGRCGTCCARPAPPRVDDLTGKSWPA
jgi:hypothetical protein